MSPTGNLESLIQSLDKAVASGLIEDDLRYEILRKSQLHKPVNILFTGFGNITKSTIETLIQDSQHNRFSRQIENILISSRDPNKHKSEFEHLKSEWSIQQSLINIEMMPQSELPHCLSYIDLALITAGNDPAKPSRNSMTIANIPIIDGIAPYFRSNFKGIVNIVTNLPELLAHRFAQKSDLDPRQITGNGEIDRIRFHHIVETLLGTRILDLDSFCIGYHGGDEKSGAWPIYRGLKVTMMNDDTFYYRPTMAQHEIANYIRIIGPEQWDKKLLTGQIGTPTPFTTAAACSNTVKALTDLTMVNGACYYDGRFVLLPMRLLNGFGRVDTRLMDRLTTIDSFAIDKAIQVLYEELDLNGIAREMGLNIDWDPSPIKIFENQEFTEIEREYIDEYASFGRYIEIKNDVLKIYKAEASLNTDFSSLDSISHSLLINQDLEILEDKLLKLQNTDIVKFSQDFIALVSSSLLYHSQYTHGGRKIGNTYQKFANTMMDISRCIASSRGDYISDAIKSIPNFLSELAEIPIKRDYDPEIYKSEFEKLIGLFIHAINWELEGNKEPSYFNKLFNTLSYLQDSEEFGKLGWGINPRINDYRRFYHKLCYSIRAYHEIIELSNSIDKTLDQDPEHDFSNAEIGQPVLHMRENIDDYIKARNLGAKLNILLPESLDEYLQGSIWVPDTFSLTAKMEQYEKIWGTVPPIVDTDF